MFENLLIEKYRPSTLKDIVLSDNNRRYFENISRLEEIPHLMFEGSPGTGKSSLALILVKEVLKCQYLYINASDESGIDTIRSKVINFAQTKSIDGKLKVVILDEFDGTSSVTSGQGKTSAQQALRNVMEEYSNNTRFIMTCNYPYKVIEAIHSRCQHFDLTPPFDGCVKRVIDILRAENITVDETNKSKLAELIKANYPDLRKIIGSINKYIIDKKLVIDEIKTNLKFAEEVFNKLLAKEDLIKLREFVIHNEIKFDNDYHQLLKGLFEVVYNSSLYIDKKRPAMLLISNAMLQHQQAMDSEINAYSCILELAGIL